MLEMGVGMSIGDECFGWVLGMSVGDECRRWVLGMGVRVGVRGGLSGVQRFAG